MVVPTKKSEQNNTIMDSSNPDQSQIPNLDDELTQAMNTVAARNLHIHWSIELTKMSTSWRYCELSHPRQNAIRRTIGKQKNCHKRGLTCSKFWTSKSDLMLMSVAIWNIDRHRTFDISLLPDIWHFSTGSFFHQREDWSKKFVINDAPRCPCTSPNMLWIRKSDWSERRLLKEDFAGLMRDVYYHAFTPANITNAFKSTYEYPSICLLVIGQILQQCLMEMRLIWG